MRTKKPVRQENNRKSPVSQKPRGESISGIKERSTVSKATDGSSGWRQNRPLDSTTWRSPMTLTRVISQLYEREHLETFRGKYKSVSLLLWGRKEFLLWDIKRIWANIDVFEYRFRLKFFSHKKIPQRQLKISNQLREDTWVCTTVKYLHQLIKAIITVNIYWRLICYSQFNIFYMY